MSLADLVLTPTGLRAYDRKLPCTVGRNGLTSDKREGDLATPRGEHRIVGTLWRPDRLRRPAAWAEPLRPLDMWSEDPADPDYNRLVRGPHPYARDRMFRADPLYDLVLVVDWNFHDPIPGKGSAIFIHQWRRPGFPTAGCLGLRRDHLIWLAGLAAPGTRLIVP